MGDNMLLYHGTTETVARLALKEGLKPRGRRKGNWESCPSHPQAVYLTNAYAGYYAICAIKPGERGAVIEIDETQLDPCKLAPDEDACEQLMRGRDGIKGTMIERTNYYRENLKQFRGQHKTSLRAMGTCAHLGKIPASAITRVAIFDPRKISITSCFFLDPCISILNYRLVGNKYRGLTKWLFGHDLGEDAPSEIRADTIVVPTYILPPDAEKVQVEYLDRKSACAVA